jgi:uncharacterized protein YegP (UPF0339 family)
VIPCVQEPLQRRVGASVRRIDVPPYVFIVYVDEADEWRWTLWSSRNRRTLADCGEGFVTVQSCRRNIALIKRVVPMAPIRYHESARQ